MPKHHKMDNKTFYLGLCMAGAVSAGAYTAGVMDFLIESLQAWDDAKKRSDPTVPTHDVQLSAIGGASAGGMTGIIVASGLGNAIDPVKLPPAGQPNDPGHQPSNKFFDAWVDLLQDDMLTVMLGTGDLAKGKAVSLLNADFIEQVANKMITAGITNPVERSYIAEELLLFATMTNLQGFAYDLDFHSNDVPDDKYITTAHNDLATFRVALDTPAYKNDGFIPLSVKDNTNLDLARAAAMATGAFPVGLASRSVTREANYVNDNRRFLNLTPPGKDVVPVGAPYTGWYTDGGLVNNEPFDVTRKMLNITEGVDTHPANYTNYDTTNSTIVMVAPFPSQPEEQTFDGSPVLTNLVGNVLGAMITQLRFKPEELNAVFNKDDASHYLIAPVREDKVGDKAIACGAMSGFSGFIHRSFRVHDYFLGRRNCQKFLQDVFVVPANTTNPIFVNGYAGVADKTPYTYVSDTNWLQIIPVLITDEERLPDWPKISFDYITNYSDQMETRLQQVIFSLFDLNWAKRTAYNLALKGNINDAALKWIKKSLTAQGLV